MSFKYSLASECPTQLRLIIYTFFHDMYSSKERKEIILLIKRNRPHSELKSEPGSRLAGNRIRLRLPSSDEFGWARTVEDRLAFSRAEPGGNAEFSTISWGSFPIIISPPPSKLSNSATGTDTFSAYPGVDSAACSRSMASRSPIPRHCSCASNASGSQRLKAMVSSYPFSSVRRFEFWVFVLDLCDWPE